MSLNRKKVVVYIDKNERMKITKSYNNETLKLLIRQIKVKTETKRTN